MLYKKYLFAAFTVISLFLCGCAGQDCHTADSSVRDVFAMDTFMELKVYGDEPDNILDLSEKRIKELDEKLSVTSGTSLIWKIDHSQGGAVDIDEDVYSLIKKASEIGGRTDGALDITIYPVLKEWGFTTGDYHVPSEDTLDRLLKNVDYSKIELTANSVRIPEDAQIDLGALAKGYTGDEVIKLMKENGADSAIINLGGNVQTLGKKPDGSNWRIAVKDPFSPEKDMCVIAVSDKAVVTSGNYERFFTGADGRRYWHIIDPEDGYPADNGLVSVTVIGSKGIECDALSTAFFVVGYERICKYLKDFQDIDVILVTDDGRILYTAGIEESFENLSSMTAEVICFE